MLQPSMLSKEITIVPKSGGKILKHKNKSNDDEKGAELSLAPQAAAEMTPSANSNKQGLVSKAQGSLKNRITTTQIENLN